MLLWLLTDCICLEVKIGVLDTSNGILTRGPAVTEAIKNFTADGIFEGRNISIR